MRIAVLSAVFAALACGRTLPETHHYDLSEPPARATGSDVGVLTIEELTAEAAYDDDRIIYRTSPVRLDYYEYHRWSSPPAELVSDYLRRAYSGSGGFCLVVGDHLPQTSVILGGRLIAFEEVDVTKTRWVGRVELELYLTDARTRDVLWRRRITEQQPLDSRDPEGLARALSKAMARIVARTAPELAGITRERAVAGGAQAIACREPAQH